MSYQFLNRSLFRLCLLIGAFSFFFMFVLTCAYWYKGDIQSFKEMAPATAILLSALIAATTIIRNSHHSEMSNKRIEDRSEKNKNILIKSHLKYFISEANTQIETFQNILQLLPNINNGTIDITPYLYDEKMNENKIIKNLDYLLSPDLHKYSAQTTIDLILKFKAQVLDIIHDIQIMKDAWIPNKQIEDIKEMLTNHIKEIHTMKLKLIVLQNEI